MLIMPAQYAIDSRTVHLKTLGRMTDWLRRAYAQNFLSFVVCQPCLPFAATFVPHIMNVVSDSAQKQMCRTDTSSIVTAMADTHGKQWYSVHQFPTKTMCEHDIMFSVFPLAAPKDAVAIWSAHTSPYPALCRLLYSRPKTSCRRNAPISLPVWEQCSRLRNAGIPASVPVLWRGDSLWHRLSVPIKSLTTFPHHILHIVCCGPKKQMIGTHTQPDIADMTDAHFTGNRPIVQFPAIAMNIAKRTSNTKNSIANFQTRTSPQPARRSFVDRSPKAFKRRSIPSTSMMPLNKTHWFPFALIIPLAVTRRNASLFTAPAMTIPVRNIRRNDIRHHSLSLSEVSLYAGGRNTAARTGGEHLGQRDQLQPSRVVQHSIACAGGQA